MPTPSVRQLDDDQLQSFDWEFVDEKKQQTIWRHIDADFPTGTFRFIDIGGGNGSFADRVLARYPKAEGAVLDNSRLLLARNTPHPRKKVLCGSAEDIRQLSDEPWDIVFMNFLLHHLVGESYEQSRKNQSALLLNLRSVLNENGRISIFENIYDGVFLHGLPSYLIYRLTSLQKVAPVMRRLGANTAGIGVCFLSKKQWDSVLESAGLKTLSYSDSDRFTIPAYKKLLLHLGDIRGGHYWCRF